MADANKDVSESLRPIEMEASIDAELAALNRGKGARGVLVAAVAVVAIVGAVVLMKGLDEGRAFADAAQAVDALEEEHVGAFENCTLTGMNRHQVKGELDLVAELDRRSSRLGRAYVRTVDRCLRSLDRLAPALAALEVPPALAPERDALRKAAAAQKASWRAHLDYLDDERLEYSSEAARPRLAQIAADWRVLHEAHAAFDAEAAKAR